MIDIYREDLQKSGLSCGRDGVGRVVRVSPCIGTIGETTIRKVVYYALVRVIFGTHEDETREVTRSGTEPRVVDMYSLL
jgi:hypothetical protein